MSTRTLRTLGVLTAVAVVLTAIAAWTIQAVRGTPATSTTPTIGACYDYPADDFGHARSWSAAPVDCATRHTAETFAIVPAASVPSTRPASVVRAKQQYCTVTDLDAWLDARPAGFLTMYEALVAYPDQAAWDAGQRWIRCDVALPDVGILQASTGSTRHVLAGKALLPYAQCQVPHRFPDGMGTAIKACKGRPTAAVSVALVILDRPGATFAVRRDASYAACTRAVAPFVRPAMASSLRVTVPDTDSRSQIECTLSQAALLPSITGASH
jgi:hypothetical protein